MGCIETGICLHNKNTFTERLEDRPYKSGRSTNHYTRSSKMAFPTSVNDQITDAVTQSNVKVVAEAPAMAMASIYQTMAHSTGILFQNAVSAQQQQNTLSQASTNQGVMQIYSVDTTAGAAATEKVAQGGVADNLTSLLTVLQSFSKPTGL